MKINTPEHVAHVVAAARALQPKFRQRAFLRPYSASILALVAKGYSFAWITRFLNEKLHVTLARATVYAVYREASPKGKTSYGK